MTQLDLFAGGAETASPAVQRRVPGDRPRLRLALLP